MDGMSGLREGRSEREKEGVEVEGKVEAKSNVENRDQFPFDRR